MSGKVSSSGPGSMSAVSNADSKSTEQKADQKPLAPIFSMKTRSRSVRRAPQRMDPDDYDGPRRKKATPPTKVSKPKASPRKKPKAPPSKLKQQKITSRASARPRRNAKAGQNGKEQGPKDITVKEKTEGIENSNPNDEKSVVKVTPEKPTDGVPSPKAKRPILTRAASKEKAIISPSTSETAKDESKSTPESSQKTKTQSAAPKSALSNRKKALWKAASASAAPTPKPKAALKPTPAAPTIYKSPTIASSPLKRKDDRPKKSSPAPITPPAKPLKPRSKKSSPNPDGPLAGVVAVVEVHAGSFNAQFDCSDVVAKKMETLGAVVISRLMDSVTHVVISHLTPKWRDKLAKYQSSFKYLVRKRVDERADIQVVNELWVHNCSLQNKWLDEKLFFPLSQEEIEKNNHLRMTPPKVEATTAEMEKKSSISPVNDSVEKSKDKGTPRGDRKRRRSLQNDPAATFIQSKLPTKDFAKSTEKAKLEATSPFKRRKTAHDL